MDGHDPRAPRKSKNPQALNTKINTGLNGIRMSPLLSGKPYGEAFFELLPNPTAEKRKTDCSPQMHISKTLAKEIWQVPFEKFDLSTHKNHCLISSGGIQHVFNSQADSLSAFYYLAKPGPKQIGLIQAEFNGEFCIIIPKQYVSAFLINTLNLHESILNDISSIEPDNGVYIKTILKSLGQQYAISRPSPDKVKEIEKIQSWSKKYNVEFLTDAQAASCIYAVVQNIDQTNALWKECKIESFKEAYKQLRNSGSIKETKAIEQRAATLGKQAELFGHKLTPEEKMLLNRIEKNISKTSKTSNAHDLSSPRPESPDKKQDKTDFRETDHKNPKESKKSITPDSVGKQKAITPKNLKDHARKDKDKHL